MRWRSITATLLIGGVVGALGGCGGEDDGGGSPAGTGSNVTDAGFDAALDAAEQRLDTGDRESAETILSSAVRRRPDDPRARELLGRVAMGRATDAAAAGASTDRVRELHAEAWEQYRRALPGRPDDAGLRTSAGLVALAAGASAEALRCFDEAAALDATQPQPRLYAGQIRLSDGAFDEAEADFAAVLAIDPDEPYALASLAAVRLEQGRTDEAIDLAGRARAAAPDEVALRVQEIRVIRLAGQPRAALARLLAIPAEDRVSMGLVPELAATHRALGRPADAAAAWESAWVRTPDGPERAAMALAVATAWADANEIESAWSWVATTRAGIAFLDAEDRAAVEELEARLRTAVDPG